MGRLMYRQESAAAAPAGVEKRTGFYGGRLPGGVQGLCAVG